MPATAALEHSATHYGFSIPTASASRGASGKAAGRSKHLVVDESPTIRVRAAELLEKLGVAGGDVEVATDPSEALETFRAVRPSVVFMELDYEDGDGLPVALTMLSENPHVRLVVFTAEDRASPRVRRIVRAGAFAVVEKPLRQEKLRQVMNELQMEEGGVERMR